MKRLFFLIIALAIAVAQPANAQTGVELNLRLRHLVEATRATVCANAPTPKCDYDFMQPALLASTLDVLIQLAIIFETFGEKEKGDMLRKQISADTVELNVTLARLTVLHSKK